MLSFRPGLLRLLTCLLLTVPVWAQNHSAPAVEPASNAAAPAELPQDIYIKSPTQTFNSRFYYALHQGKIWIKANRQVTGLNEPWQLMICNGLPCQPDNPDFPVPKMIKEISADADELTAIDDRGHFYIRTMEGPGWFSKTEWTNLNGFPKSELKLSESHVGRRAWSMGRRHFDVLWHEDADGNQHHVGTMGTSSIYLLNADGNEIWFTDNGLPADISHIACGPERGTVISENLQASAGTLMLIDAAGQIYTSMDDFDLNGGTSMFISYTYTPQPRYEKPTGKDYPSHLKPWRLPLEHWRKQPLIPLTGQAKISKAITISQNGQGNAARELRVAGRDPQGKMGYYFKPVFADKWSFQPAVLSVPDDHWLDPSKATRTRVLSQDTHYGGSLRLGNGEAYIVEIRNFNLHCSPATMRIYLPDGPVDVLLHTVDAWISVKRLDPGRDGSIQLMLGTLDAPPEALAKLPKILKDLNLATFALQLGATTDQLIMFYLDGRVQALLPRIQPLPPSIKTHNYHYVLPPGSYATSSLRQAKMDMTRTLDPSLVRIDLENVPNEELEILNYFSHELLKQLQAEEELVVEAKGRAWMEASFAMMARSFYGATGMCWWAPNGQAICRTAPVLLGASYRIEDELNREALIRYRAMIKQVAFRIERYEKRLREVNGPDWKMTPPQSQLIEPKPTPTPEITLIPTESPSP